VFLLKDILAIVSSLASVLKQRVKVKFLYQNGAKSAITMPRVANFGVRIMMSIHH
jgi:hypothetical protein